MAAGQLVVFVHVLAAATWVATAIGLAWLEPKAREDGEAAVLGVSDTVRSVSWGSYAVLWGTGVANVMRIDAGADSRFGTVFLVKLVLVGVGGAALWKQSEASSPAALRLFSSVLVAAAVGTLYAGLQLGHTDHG